MVEDFEPEIWDKNLPLQFIVKNRCVHGILIADTKSCDRCYDEWRHDNWDHYTGDYPDYRFEHCYTCGLKVIPDIIGDLMSLEFLILFTEEKVKLPLSIKDRNNLRILITYDVYEVDAFNRYRRDSKRKDKEFTEFRYAMLPQSEVEALKGIEEVYGKIILGREFDVENNSVIKIKLNSYKDKKIEMILPSIKNLINLRELNLDINKMIALPDEIG